MTRILIAGLAFGLVACSGSGAKDASSTGEVARGTPTVSAATRTLGPGTTVQATIQEPISSATNTNGQHVKAIVARNVVDASGLIVIPGGAELVLTITDLRAAKGPTALDGVIVLGATTLTVDGTAYEPRASVGVVAHTLVASAKSPADRDVIVTAGTPITITLTQPLKIAAK